MTSKKIISLLLCIVMLTGLFSNFALADSAEKTTRTVYLHAQGRNPDVTVNNSTVYIGENADIYFSIDNPNKGDYDKATDTHKEPQYDLNGYTLRIFFDATYFDFAGNSSAPIDYKIPDENIDTSEKDDEELGEDTGTNVPQTKGYFVYKHGNGTYTLGEKTYTSAYITVFYSGGYVPQKEDGQLWYDLAKLSLVPKKTGSTFVFLDVDSGDEDYTLELFAKNQSDELSDQTFTYNVINGGYHYITIKDKTKPAPPVATPGSGSYVDKVTVELTQEKGLPIYYTLDGSEPAGNPQRIKYDGPIEIEMDTTIKACSFREADDKYSNSVSYEYKIIPDRPYLFDEDKVILPDINSLYTKSDVYVSDKDVFGNIEDGSEVYYTFAELDAQNPVIGTNPETDWVKVEKMNPVIEIDKNRTVRLITDKLGKYSEVALYYFTIKPLAPESNYYSGEYDKKIDVTLSCDTEGAVIYYTTDGSDPQTNGLEYTNIPITLFKDTTLRAVSFYDGEWSDKVSYYYIFNFYDDFGVDAFYPSGVYEGSVNVTLTPNNPHNTVMYHTGDGQWKEYDDVLVLDSDTDLVAKAVEYDENGSVKTEGEEYTFVYKIKPLPPEFAPESTQFTNANKITVYTIESTESNTSRYKLYYTLDGTDPITSRTRILADDASDTAVIDITKYTVATAVVLKDGVSYSNVVKHSYDIVTVKPVKPLTTLAPGYYIHEIGGEGFETQFMPVPKGTKIYYTINYDGALCPDPVPNTEGTYEYDGTSFIDIKGNTVIKAVAVNSFGVKSDIGIFPYVVTPEASKAAPSATINGTELPLVPVDAVDGSTVKYTIGGFTNEFVNSGDERFYIDTSTGMAYRDELRTQQLGAINTSINTGNVTLTIFATLDGIESDVNRYTYAVTNRDVIAPPYADKETGTYREEKIDSQNNLLKVMLYSLNSGGKIQYRINNSGEWEDYDGNGVLFKEDAVLQIRYAKGNSYSSVVSYVYHFVPLAPIIELPSGRYLESDNKTTKISLNPLAPDDKNYSIWYRQNGDPKDYRYTGQERAITHTMSFKAYVLNEDTGVISDSTIHYYIIESGNAASGNVYIAYPYDTDRINSELLVTEDYAEGIKLISQNKTADIHYYYTYTKKSDGQSVTTNTAIYDVTRPIIPTTLMDDITIVAWLEDENGMIEGSDEMFYIDFVDLKVPKTSLTDSGKKQFSKGTQYTLINDYPGDENIILYYTLDGSDPSWEENPNRIEYKGETLTLNKKTTVKTAYFSACGKCVECKVPNKPGCWSGIWGKVGVYEYDVITSAGSGGGGGGGRGNSQTNDEAKEVRRYTKDIFLNEHPTHIGYINGYPDGSVQPEGDITREEVTVILYRITNHEYEKPFVATGEVFPDVAYERWSTRDIEYMADKGIVEGYPDGDFKPSRNLTRAEFAALIYRFTKVKKSKMDNPFTDLDNSHWAYDEIMTLAKSGLIEGYPDKTYRPEDNISRAEVMTVINKVLGRNPLESYVKSLDFNPFNDLFVREWYYVTVLEATITHNYWLDKKDYEYKWEDIK